MKKLALLILICVTNNCFTQDSISSGFNPLEYKNVLTFNIFTFMNSTFQLNYERVLKENNNIVFNMSIKYKSSTNQVIQSYKAELQYKCFLFNIYKKKTSKRMYFAPYIFAKYSEEKCMDTYPYYYYDYPVYIDTTYSYTDYYYYNAYGTGIMAGFELIFVKRLYLDMYLGGGIRRTFEHNNLSVKYDDGSNSYYYTHYNNSVWDEGYSGIEPRIGFNFGFNF